MYELNNCIQKYYFGSFNNTQIAITKMTQREGKKHVPFCMAIENVELMRECCPQH